MINLTVGDNAGRTSVIIDENTTLRQALEGNNVDYSTGLTSLDGSTLKPGDLNKTFAELGYNGQVGHDRCFLLNVKKLDNA